MTRTRWCWLAAAVLLAGCGSRPNRELLPLAGSAGDPAGLSAGATPLSFDTTAFTGSPYSRNGTTSTTAAIAVSTTGVRAANGLGDSFAAYNESSSGLKTLDQAIFVPSRLRRARAAHRASDSTVVELVDEPYLDCRITGTVRSTPSSAAITERTDMLITGPLTRLAMTIVMWRSNRTLVQIEGTDVGPDGHAVRLKIEQDEVHDQATNIERGQERQEYRTIAGKLIYAVSEAFEHKIDTENALMVGRSIEYDADGYWVASDYNLHQYDATHALGSYRDTASDGSGLTLHLLPDGTANGNVTEAGAPVANLLWTQSLPAGVRPAPHDVTLVDLDEDTILDELGEPVGFDLDLKPAPATLVAAQRRRRAR